MGTRNAGESYVVFGSSGGFAASLDLSALDGSNGFRLDGIDAFDDESGWSVSGAGDVNGDGIADLIIGALRRSGWEFRRRGELCCVRLQRGLRRQPGSLRSRRVQRLPP